MPLDASSITWTAEVPPFRGNAFVAFAPDGKLWIQRTTFGREGARYDLIGPDGALVDRVQLPGGHRVVGFGRDAMTSSDVSNSCSAARSSLLRKALTTGDTGVTGKPVRQSDLWG